VSGSTVVLETQDLTRHFRGFRAVDGVGLVVREGMVHALVGPNGAGKTTLFHLLSGFLAPSSGRILLDGRDVTGLRADQMVHRGVARSFQITSLFPALSLRDHVELALQGRRREGLRFWRSERLLDAHRDRAEALLDDVGLGALADVPAGAVSYGRKRALELAIALALDPRVLLLDEPTAGMGLEDVQRTIDLIQTVRAGRTVVLVEHNMRVVGTLADHVTVLQRGRILADGGYEQVRADPRVITAYLGEAPGGGASVA
jgi:branched-chain amino acid transport system ATP-binding protein